MTYTVVVQLNGALAGAVAVEWTDRDAPGDAQGAAGAAASDWQPCIRIGDRLWRFASRDGVEPRPHLRAPGRFGNIAIRYRMTPAGPWSAASADRKEIIIRAEGGDGEIPALPPLMVAAPTLAGTGKIGSPVTAGTGTWTGAESFTFQWCRDGADITGATEATYTPVGADDLTELACRVLATGPGGQVEAVTAALTITHVAPTVRTEDVLDEIHDAGTGVQRVETAAYFTGEALVFTVSGAGATIDPETGVVGIPTDEPVAGETVVVTARNSGGSALLRLLVTVEAAPIGEVPVQPAALTENEWEIVGFWQDPRHPGRAGPVIEVTRQGINPTMLVWDNTSHQRTPGLPCFAFGTNWTVPALPGQTAIPPSGRPRFALRASVDTANWHTGAPGWTSPRHSIRWTDAVLPEPDANNTNDVNMNPQMAWIRDGENQAKFFSPYSTGPAPDNGGKSWTVPAGLFQAGETGGRGESYSLGTLSSAAHAQLDSTGLPGFDQFTTDGMRARNPFQTHAWIIMGLEAQRSAAYDTRLLALCREMLKGNEAFTCAGSYTSQHEAKTMMGIALVRHTPRIWNALNATERSRLTLMAEACLVSACWEYSQYVQNTSGEPQNPGRSIAGRETWPGGNVNFHVGKQGMIWSCIAFFGGPAEAQAVLNTIDVSGGSSGVHARLNSAGLTNPASWWARTLHSSAGAPGPMQTISGRRWYNPVDPGRIAAAIRPSGGIWRTRSEGGNNFRLQDLQAWLDHIVAARFFPHAVAAGHHSSPAHNGSPAGWFSTVSVNGISNGDHVGGMLGRTPAASTTNAHAQRWRRLRWPPNGVDTGQPAPIGMAQEFSTNDGGGGSSPSAQPWANQRSSMSYVMGSVWPVPEMLMALHVLGHISIPALSASTRSRIRVGLIDVNCKNRLGYNSIARNGVGNSERWRFNERDDEFRLTVGEAWSERMIEWLEGL